MGPKVAGVKIRVKPERIIHAKAFELLRVTYIILGCVLVREVSTAITAIKNYTFRAIEMVN